MVSIIKKNKELIILIGILLALGICIELPSWLQGGYFVGGGDIKTQWYPFYVLNRRETVNALKNGSFPFYSWIVFLGNNIWASKTSYGLLDIFNLIFYFCKNNYFWIYDVQIILKLLVAGICFYFYINYVFNNKKAGLLGGVLYVSSSYLLYFTSQSGFLSFVALVPLYLLGIEYHLKENKNILFIISTTILLLTNYYLFFALTIFSPIYFIYRYYNINKQIKDVFKETLIMIGYYLIGLLMSLIVILPTFLYVIQSERMGGTEESLVWYKDIRMYLHIFCASFVPNDLYIYGNNVFDYNEHTLKELCLFSSYLIPVVIPQLFVCKNKELKKSSFIVYFIFILFLLIPALNGILNAFIGSCFRWTYIILIFNIYLVCYILFVDKDISKKVLLNSFIIEAIIMLASFFGAIFFVNASIKDYFYQLIIIVISIVCIGLYSLFISNKKKIIVLLVIELTLHSVLFGMKNINSSVKASDLEAVTTVLSDEYSPSIKDYLNSLDSINTNIFYRTYVSYGSLYWEFSRNMNLIYDFEGLMTYDSTISPSYSELKKINKKGVICDIDWELSIIDPDLLDFLSCKYALTVSEDEIPFKEYKVIDSEYRGGIIVSENTNYEPICVTYTKTENTIPNNYSTLKEEVITDNKDINKYFKSNISSRMENINYFGNHLDGTITSDDDSFAILKLSYDDGFRIRVNDKNVPIYKCNGGVIGFPIEKGTNNINVDFVPKGFKAGAILSACGFVLFACVIFLQIKRFNQE